MKRSLLIIACAVSVMATAQSMSDKVANAARSLENPFVEYKPDYVRIAYPFGDVPENTGVCSDVVIRTLRLLGIDLQIMTNEYMLASGRTPDTNIDHRRVRNLWMVMDADSKSRDVYKIFHSADKPSKGDIIIWELFPGQLHTGVMVSNDSVIHNIGAGQVIEPIAYCDYTIKGVYGLDEEREIKLIEGRVTNQIEVIRVQHKTKKSSR